MAWQPDYATLAELRAYVRIPVGDTLDDADLTLAIGSTSRAVDQYCDRQFGKVDSLQARYYTAMWDPRRWRYRVEIDDLMTSVGVEVSYDDGTLTFPTAVDFTKCRLDPLNAAADGEPWTTLILPENTTAPCGVGDVEVTATWGWTAVPDEVKQATLIQSARIIKRRDSPFGVAGSPEMGNELRLLSKLDPDVCVLLSSVRKWSGGIA